MKPTHTCLGIVLSLYTLSISISHAQWTQTNGPYAGSANVFETVGDRLIVGSVLDGIWISSDQGDSWTLSNNGLRRLDVNCLAVIGATIVAGTGDGIFRSTDSGTNWTEVPGLLHGNIVDVLLAVDTVLFAGVSYLGGSGRGVFRSIDSGSTWTEVNEGLTLLTIAALATCKGGAGTQGIYAAAETASRDRGSLFFSADFGEHWTDVGPGFANTKISSIAFVDSGIIIGTCGDGMFSQSMGVWITTDHGSTWAQVNDALVDWHITALAAVPDSSGTVIAGTLSGVYRCSARDGFHWSTQNSGLTDRRIAMIATEGNSLYAGAAHGLFRSSDRGDTWRAVGMSHTRILALAAARDSARPIVAGAWEGAYVSTDGGMDWVLLSDDPLVRTFYTAGFDGDDLLFGGFRGVVYRFATDPWAVGWTMDIQFNGLPGKTLGAMTGRDSILFVGTYGSGIYRSTDHGKFWTETNTGLTNLVVYSLWTGAGSDTAMFAGTAGGMFRSTDAGFTWDGASQGLVSGSTVYGIASKGRYFFAATNRGLYRSSDGGAVWSSANAGFPSVPNPRIKAVAVDPFREGSLFALEDTYGIYFTLDDGVRWTSLNDGLPGQKVLTISVNDSYLFAAISDRGVWRRPLSEIPTSVDPALDRSSDIANILPNHPNPFHGMTTIAFTIGDPGCVKLTVHDILGHEVAIIIDEKLSTGTRSHAWDAGRLPAGVYVVRLIAGSEIRSRVILNMGR